MLNRAELRRSLEALQVADALEGGHRSAVLELLSLPGDVESRTHYVPGHLTASAFVLSPDESSLLLIHHSKLGRWLQPGGHLDPEDQSLLAAARREVSEETGLDDLELLIGPFDVDVHAIPSRGDAPAHLHFDVRYLFCARSEVVRGGSDALDARWFPLQVSGEWATDESVLRAVRKLASR